MPIIVKISEKLSTQLLAYQRIPPHWSYERVSLCDNMWTKSVWEQLQKILAFEISEPIKISPESRPCLWLNIQGNAEDKGRF